MKFRPFSFSFCLHCHSDSWIKIQFILDTVFIMSLIQMTDLVRRQMNHVVYLLQSWGETCCSWTCQEVGAGALVWPWAPSISSPRTSRAVSWKHCQDQPQGSLSHVLLDIEWRLHKICGEEERKEVNHKLTNMSLQSRSRCTGAVWCFKSSAVAISCIWT